MTDKPNQASAREVVPASSPREQRREGRYDVPFPIEVSGVDPDGQVFYQRTSTRNVSEWGCGFLLSIELKGDDIIALRVLSDRPEASAQTRPSLFQVRHVARNPVTGEVIMQVDEQQLRQPNFFSASLAQDCLRAQIEQERFGQVDKTLGPESAGELRLVVIAKGNKVPVTLQQKESGARWDIIDARRHEAVGTLTPEIEEHMNALTAFVQELFTQK